VWRYDGKTFKNFSTKDGLSHYGVWSLLEDKAGNIWVGTRNTAYADLMGKLLLFFRNDKIRRDGIGLNIVGIII
jgi:hypothetical protein